MRANRDAFFNLRHAVAAFRRVHGAEHVPIGTFQIFVEVSLNPSCDITDLMGSTGLSQGAVSRHVGMLEDGIPNSKGEVRKGLGLVVSARHPRDWRRKLIYPTAKGRTLAIEMFSILRPDLPQLRHSDFADVRELEDWGKS